MKKIVTIIGFAVATAAGLYIMSVDEAMRNQPTAPWGFGGVHMERVARSISGMTDKCKLDRLQGRLKDHQESANCSNPTIHEAFIKEGYPFPEKVDVFTAKRLELSRLVDEGKMDEAQMKKGQDEALSVLLDAAVIADIKK